MPHGAVVTHAAFGLTPWDPAHPLRIVTGARDGKVRIWDGATGAPLQTLDAHKGFVTRTLFSPDGRRVLSSSMDHTGRIWDTASGRELAVLRGHTEGIYAAASAPMAGALPPRPIGTARFGSGTRPPARRSPCSWATAAASRTWRSGPNGRQVVSASIDGTARVWDVLPEGEELLDLARTIVTNDHLRLTPERRHELLAQHAD